MMVKRQRPAAPKYRKTTVRVTNKPILLVEDDQVDMMRVTRALKEIHVTNQIVYRENGEDALNYLQDENSDKPCLILLDLNMPVMNGIEFLQAVKKDERLRGIPVVVLTTSNDQQDKLNSFNLGVAGYVAKPVDYRQFVEVMRSIDAYWTISAMPHNH
jgi:CheY-like chemotaxis protein